MRPKFLVGVIVGLLLIYLSFFGLSGLGLAMLPDTPENFTTYTKVDSGSYLSVTSLSVLVTNMPRSAVSYVYKDFGGGHFGDFHLQFESQVTAIQLETGLLFLTLANNIGPSVQMAATTIGFGIGHNSSGYYFILGDGRVSGGSISRLVTTDPLALYYYDLARTSSVVTLGIFTSSAYSGSVATLTCVINDKFQYLYVSQSLGVVGSTLTASGKTQNLRIAGGGANPTYSDVTLSVSGQGSIVPAAGHYATTYYVGGSLTITATPALGWSFDYMTRNGVTTSSMTLSPLLATENVVVYFKTGSSTTGMLRVFAFYNDTYVVASVIASGAQIVTGQTTTDSNQPLTFTVTAGTYTISGTYAYGSATPVSVTVPAGGSVDANLNFGGSSPAPDIFAVIRNLFNNPTVKQLMLIGGGLTTLICGIMFVLPGEGERRSRLPPPDYPRYY